MEETIHGPARPLQRSAINYPSFVPRDVPDDFPKYIYHNLVIATLISDEMYENLQYECPLLDIRKYGELDISEKPSPDLLLVESQFLNYSMTTDIINLFNSNDIPTVLWISAPLDTTKILDMLSLFKHVFTTDYESIVTIRSIVNHDNVHYLPLAVQPRLYNPITTGKKTRFAAYMPMKLIQSRKITYRKSKLLFAAAKRFAADIIVPEKDTMDMISNLKKYRVLLFDSIPKFNTGNSNAFLYELLASGINVITLYDKKLEEAFGNRLLFVKSYKEAAVMLNKLSKDPDDCARLSLLGQRYVFSSHTYTHRIDTILDKLGYHHLRLDKPGISVVCCTHMTAYMNNIFENYNRQTYDKKELVVVLNDPDMDKSIWEEKAKQFPNVRIIQPITKKSVGYCTNLAIDHAVYDYVANFDHDDYYGPEYLRDNLNVFKYTDAGLIGKKTHYLYYEGPKTLAVMLPDYENMYVVNIDGSSIVVKKKIFKKVCFVDDLFADIQFSIDCWNNDIKVYSCDSFNHVYIRRASKEHHAFKLSDAEFKQFTYTLFENIEDYTFYVNI